MRALLPSPSWLAVCLSTALLPVALCPPAARPAGAALSDSVLADSVLATLGPRAVTRAEFLRQWQGLAPELRPRGEATEGMEATERIKRAFLDELINKEALSLATDEMGFTPGPEESAGLANLRVSLMRQEYYRRMVLDSLPPGDGTQVRSGAADAGASPEAARESQLIDRLVAPLAPRFDDSAAALLARAFAKLPRPREEGPGWLRLQVTTWPPPVLPGDTARALATSVQGPFSVGSFLWFWARVPAAQRDRPDTPGAVIEWTKSFIAQGLIDAECERRGYGAVPHVRARMEARRRVMAVESYYRRVVLARVDTSDAGLEAVWRKDPARFHGTPHDLYHALWYATEAEARAALGALAAGAPWDSLLLARYPPGDDPELALVTRAEAELFRDPQVLAPARPDSALRASFAGARPGQAFGPRERAGQWWVYRFLRHADGRRDSFAEARPSVLQRVLAEEGEAQLEAHLGELRRRYGVRVNQAALAALALPPSALSLEPGGPPSDRGKP